VTKRLPFFCALIYRADRPRGGLFPDLSGDAQEPSDLVSAHRDGCKPLAASGQIRAITESRIERLFEFGIGGVEPALFGRSLERQKVETEPSAMQRTGLVDWTGLRA